LSSERGLTVDFNLVRCEQKGHVFTSTNLELLTTVKILSKVTHLREPDLNPRPSKH